MGHRVGLQLQCSTVCNCMQLHFYQPGVMTSLTRWCSSHPVQVPRRADLQRRELG